MTAVAVQQVGAHRSQYVARQSPHSASVSSSRQSRSQNHTSRSQQASPSPQSLRTDAQTHTINGTSGRMSKAAPTEEASRMPNGNAALLSEQDRGPSNSTRGPTQDILPDRRMSLQLRPTTASGESSPEESDLEKSKRRPTSALRRSKSDFGPRGEDAHSQDDEDVKDWGTRHGFGDHYASEEYVSQLANVGALSYLILCVGNRRTGSLGGLGRRACMRSFSDAL